jgi:glycosyltransferase 2 family protein
MKRWQFWLGVLISAVFLYFVVRRLDWENFWVTLKTANYWWILPGVAVYFVAVWARAWRWHYLLKPIKAIQTRVMFPITCIGYMGNNIYPARAGEVLRAVTLKRKEGVPISASLATIIVERIFDGVVMLAFVFVNLAQLARLSEVSVPVGKWQITIQDLSIWGSVAFIGALVVFLLAAMFPRLTARSAQWFIDRLLPARIREKTSGIMHKFLDGLEALRSPANVLMVFLTSVIIWLLETVKYWFVLHAFGLQGDVSFFTLMLMNGVVNLATTIPAAPGYLGTFDAPGIAVLVAGGVDNAVATGYTFVLHVALWVPITVLGAYYLAREGIKWTDSLRKEAG